MTKFVERHYHILPLLGRQVTALVVVGELEELEELDEPNPISTTFDRQTSLLGSSSPDASFQP